MWKSADGKTRRCFPVVNAFQVDYPESCKLTLVRQGMACPRCMATKCDFSNIQVKHEPRTVTRMSAIFEYAKGLDSTLKSEALCQEYGLIYQEVFII